MRCAVEASILNQARNENSAAEWKVDDYTDKDILDSCIGFYYNCKDARKFIEESTPEEIVYSDVLLKYHIYGLLKKDEPTLTQLWRDYQINLEEERIENDVEPSDYD